MAKIIPHQSKRLHVQYVDVFFNIQAQILSVIAIQNLDFDWLLLLSFLFYEAWRLQEVVGAILSDDKFVENYI